MNKAKYPKVVLIDGKKYLELRERFYNLYRRDPDFYDMYIFTVQRDKDLMYSYLNDREEIHLLELEKRGII